MRLARLSFVAATLLGASALATSAEPSCKLRAGDSIFDKAHRIRIGGIMIMQENAIRIWGVDAPDRGEPLAQESADAVAEKVSPRLYMTCRVRYRADSAAAECVASCDVNSVGDLGEALLRDGWVKVDGLHIGEDPTLAPKYKAAEGEARTAKRGLWREF